MGEQLSKNFNEDEFRCPCCGLVAMDTHLIEGLQYIRDHYRRPMKVTSGYRCEKHNKDVGGKDDSSHLIGEAADIEVGSSNQRFNLIKEAIYAGFTRLGVGDGFLHLDIDIEKPQNVIWLY